MRCEAAKEHTAEKGFIRCTNEATQELWIQSRAGNIYWVHVCLECTKSAQDR